MDALNIQYLSLFVFSAIYVFSFRESVKRSALWGAFEFGKTRFFHKKILCSSIALVLFPLCMYFFFSRIALALPLKLAGFSSPIVQIAIITTVILLLGLFPRATKHFWISIARRKKEKVTTEGESDYVWLNTAINADVLPHKLYSVQTIILLGIFPLSILLIMTIYGGIRISINLVFILKLYATLYISQIYVLYEISKKRGYYDHKPELLLSRRMILTYPTTIIIPIAFGIAISPLLLKFTSNQNWLPALFNFIYLIAALPFPYYCHQSWLIAARRNKWKSETECPELYEGKGNRFWYRCLSMAFMVLLIYALLYLFTGIGYASIYDKVQSFKF